MKWRYLLIVMRSIIVCEFGSSTGSSIKVAISGSRSSSGASSNWSYRKHKINQNQKGTYFFFLDCGFQHFQLGDEDAELLDALTWDLHTFLGAVENLGGLLEGFIAVGSSIADYVCSEGLKVRHVGVHGRQVGEQLPWLKVESFRLLDFELQAFLGRKLIEAEIDSLCKLLTKLLGDEWILAVGCDSSQ